MYLTLIILLSKSSVQTPACMWCNFNQAKSKGSLPGYKAKFETVGTECNITFELLDQRDGLVAGLWKESPLQNLQWLMIQLE
jgi:hypothetical protein